MQEIEGLNNLNGDREMEESLTGAVSKCAIL